MNKEFNIGVWVEFKDGRPPMEFDKITNTNWVNGFIHLSIEVKPAEYDKAGLLVKASELNTVASFSQDVVYSVIDIEKEKKK